MRGETPSKVIFEHANQVLVVDGRRRQLSPRAFAVLDHLVARPNQLVSKQALLDAGWPDACVVEGVLKNTVRELRESLRDNARAPAFIETVHRRGYRFVGAQRLARSDVQVVAASPGGVSKGADLPLVGREHQLRALTDSWRNTLRCEPQGCVIYGDPGIGKSTLLSAWIDGLRVAGADADIVVVRCTRTSRDTEYGGLLQALKVLSNREGRSRLSAAAAAAPGIGRLAPWLQVGERAPDTSDCDAPAALVLEAVALLDALAAERPLVLAFDDAHLLDAGTRAALMMARRCCAPVPLMLVVTTCGWHPCASPDVFTTSGDPAMGAWKRLDLAPLDAASVAHILAVSTETSVADLDLVRSVHASASGHPLIVEDVVAALDREAPAGKGGFQAPTRFLLRMRDTFAGLDKPAQRLLQAASVGLPEQVSAAAVAAVVQRPLIDVEVELDEICTTCRWLRRGGERRWPDGTLAQAYRFPLPVYRDFVYRTLPSASRQHLQLRHAERLERAYGEDSPTIAGNLALHFHAAGDTRRSQRYALLEQQRRQPLSGRPDLMPRPHCAGFRCATEGDIAGRWPS